MPVRRYYERKPLIRLFLRSVDFVTDGLVWLFSKKRTSSFTEPSKILLLTFGHLGDTLVFSYILPLIRTKYPNSIIDVVASSWCDPIWKRNPHIRQVIHVDHLICNRRPIPFWKKVLIHWQTSLKAIRQLRQEVYDLSLDIRYADPTSHFLLPFLSVQKSIGMGTRRFGGLLDAEYFVPERGSTFHHLAVSMPLFHELGLDIRLESLKPIFYFQETGLEALTPKLGFPVADQPFVLLFPETGMEEKNMPVAFWQRLLENLLNETKLAVILCGQNNQSSRIFENDELKPFRNRLIDAVGKLTIEDIATLAKRARLAISLDSFPAHFSGIWCPVLSFYKKNGTGFEFFPIGNQPVIIIHDHVNSRGATLPRPGFESIFVDELDQKSTQRLISQKIHQLNSLSLSL
ncbi:glycosyltransferase family 9 protein [Larkinella terrae]|uniref:Lipopolysaccharide heptosyltransferase family protein n=1 Tax=Larkinella terrae TaxID=2025311 RepID=A0A7K0EI21_9BACT|nr:glycosyltransferase family 9 protein [Larkinella terrae]MRS61118.1 lipopolysaccharide heptosyltransferase family protein [Larkinella terrae]